MIQSNPAKSHSAKHSWKTLNSSSLSKNSFLDLFSNHIPSIEWKDFSTKEECEKLHAALNIVGFEEYLQVEPKIGRIGVTQFESQTMGKEWYFTKSEFEKEKQKRIFQLSFDPIDRMMNKIKELFPELIIQIAKEQEKNEYFAGLIRKINQSALIHADYAAYDAPNWKIEKIVAQIAWNLCITSPESGGTCIVHNKLWNKNTDEIHKLDNSYGYHRKMVEDHEASSINVTPGDCYFFNSRNFHEVTLSVGNRVTMSCFIGLTKNQEIIIWS